MKKKLISGLFLMLWMALLIAAMVYPQGIFPVLAASGAKILDEMVIALNKVSGKKVRIIGHTDSSGDANKNIVLSQQRAEAVKNYLISKNIAAENLSVDGLGSTQPIANNLTAEGRKKNRRIEFEVL